MSDVGTQIRARVTGPGSGPNGVPAAIGISPILSARYREKDLESIAAAAPGSRLVTVSLEGLADGDLSDVEVLLRGPLPVGVFDRILARAPRLEDPESLRPWSPHPRARVQGDPSSCKQRTK